MGTLDLFGTPELDASQSQWFTPAWLARRAAQWIPPHVRVLEPSCGSGNLIDALLRRGVDGNDIMGVERDRRWFEYASDRFPCLNDPQFVLGDFLEDEYVREQCARFRPEVVFMNLPFEDNAHMRFVLRALDLAPEVIGIFPASFEFSLERDRDLWATKARVIRRARLPLRVDYGGDQSTKSDSVVLKIRRRERARYPSETLEVTEEVWLPDAA